MYNNYFSNFGRPLVPDDLWKDSAPRQPRFWKRRFLKALLQVANFTLGPMVLLIQKYIKNLVRIKAPNTVNASKRKHKNQINHYDKQRRVLIANSTVCQSK